MKQIIIKYSTQIIIKLFFLGLVFSTISCGQGLSTTARKIRETNLDNDHNQSSPLDVELTSPGKTEDSDTIEFQLINKGSEDIDLAQVKTNLAITDKKDIANIETQAGALSPIFANSNTHITSQGISGKPVYDFVGKQILTTGQTASIVVRIVNLKDLASATITCELLGRSNKNGNPITASVPVRFSPAVEPQNGDITATIKNVQFTGATNELSCEVTFKNVSKEAMRLSSLKFDLKFGGTITGSISKNSQELFKKVNILEPTQMVDALITTKIDQEDAIDDLKVTVGTDNLLFITGHLATQIGESIYDLTKQPVKLTSPDIEEVGPKQGSTMEVTIAPTIELTKNKSGEYQIVVSYELKNTSSHPIDVSQVNFIASLDGITNGNLLDHQFKLRNSTAMLKHNTSMSNLTHSISLGNMTLGAAENLLTTDTYNFTMTMKTLDGKHQLGISTQQLKFTK